MIAGWARDRATIESHSRDCGEGGERRSLKRMIGMAPEASRSTPEPEAHAAHIRPTRAMIPLRLTRIAKTGFSRKVRCRHNAALNCRRLLRRRAKPAFAVALQGDQT